MIPDSWAIMPAAFEDGLMKISLSVLQVAGEFALDPLWIIAAAACAGLDPEDCVDADVVRAVVAASEALDKATRRGDSALFEAALALDTASTWTHRLIVSMREAYHGDHTCDHERLREELRAAIKTGSAHPTGRKRAQ